MHHFVHNLNYKFLISGLFSSTNALKFALFPELLKLQLFKLRILILERFELEGFKTHGKTSFE